MTRRILALSCSVGALAMGLGALVSVGPFARTAAHAAGPGLACSVDAIQAAAPPDTVVFSADRVATPVPHCKVEGFVTSTNPGPNRNYFRLQLPAKENWKGRFYFIGLGGSAGYVPTNSQFPAGNPMVKGFAVAGTDTGHRGDLLDWRFLDDPAKMLDHKNRGGHLTTVAAQAITKAYYGVTTMYRYHSGCSGGGRMGGEALTHYPEDYDGVLLGERSGISNNKHLEFSNYRFIHNAQAMNREPGAWLSPAKLKMTEQKVTAACDASDGAVDGIVWDHRACKFDFNTIKCKAGDGPDCLTQPEITSIKAILDGPRGPDGQRFGVGWPITNMSTWSGFLGQNPPPWTLSPSAADRDRTAATHIIPYTRGTAIFGADFDPLKVDLRDKTIIDRWEQSARTLGFTEVPNPTGYERAGGKLMLFVGVSSPCCSNLEMMEWVDRFTRELGPARANNFMAMYQAPGVGHCFGGPGPQDGADVVLQALADWVEKGKRPGGIVAHRGAERVKLIFAADTDVPALPLELTGGKPLPKPLENGQTRDFLLCPYPQKSVFDRSKAGVPGAVFEAANWSCK